MAAANDSTAPQEPSPSAITENAPPPTGIGPPEDGERIPLPPPPQPPRAVLSLDVLVRWVGWLDAALVVTVLALAFLLASFLARNADLWQHLAVGRLVAQGKYSFGHDPFTYSCPDCPWVNTSWLADLGAYGLFALGGGEGGAGGPVLVVVKALLITLLAIVLLAVRRRGLGLWAPAAMTAVSLVTLSPRLSLHPICLSLLFLGLTLYLLQRPAADPDTPAGRWFRWTDGRAWVLLPILFALWANLDGWFLLGPATVLLYLLGALAQHALGLEVIAPDEPRRAELPRLALVFVIGVAACLLNPYHFHVFTTLPPELAALGLGEDLRHDAVYQDFFRSPFLELRNQFDLHTSIYDPGRGYAANVAGYAYFVLLLLGLVSFAINLDGWSWWRALVWLGFALLSGWQFRSIAFFAVVGGPISALNFQDYAARRFGTEPRVTGSWPLWSLGGRFVTLLAGLALLFLAWPGWLHAEPGVGNSPRRVAWDVDIDPSLRTAAEKLAGLRAAGALRAGDNGFNFNPDLGYYWAWFAPQEKAFLDYRLQLPADVLKTYSAVRDALPGDQFKNAESTEEPCDWEKLFREHHVKYLAFRIRDHHDRSRSATLWLDPGLRQSWTPIYDDGLTAIFSWNDPALAGERINLGKLAFGPTAERAPDDGPARTPHVEDFWEKYARAPLPEPLDWHRAELYVEYYRTAQLYWQLERQYTGMQAHTLNRIVFLLQLMLPGGTGAGPAGLLGMEGLQAPLWGLTRMPAARMLSAPDLARGDPGPPAATLLAVRAARRAIKDNPDSANSYWYLASAYSLIWNVQEEVWMHNLGESARRTQLREVQLANALQNAVLLNPRNADAHQMLAESVFKRLGFLDLELHHLQESLPIFEEDRPNLSDRERDALKGRADATRKRIDELERQVKDRTSSFVLQSRNRPALQKVSIALNLGLADKALELLQDIERDELNEKEKTAYRETLIHLYLTTGQAGRIDDGLLPSQDPWQHVLIFASLGNYAQARQYLNEMIPAAKDQNLRALLFGVRLNLFNGVINPLTLKNMVELTTSPRGWSDLLTIRGMLALEEGDIASAKADFEAALRVTDPARHLVPHLLAPIGITDPLGMLALAKAGLQNPEQPAGYVPQSPIAVNYLEYIRANE